MTGPALVSVAMAAPPDVFESRRDGCSASCAPAGGSDEDTPGAAVSGALACGSPVRVSPGGSSVTIVSVSGAGEGSLPAVGCSATSTSVTIVASATLAGVGDGGGTLSSCSSLDGSAFSAPGASPIGRTPAGWVRRFATYARGSAFPSLAIARGMADVG